MNPNSPCDGAEAILQARLTACSMLLHDKLTPFLRIQTGALILQYEDAIKQIDKLSDKELDLLNDQFDDLKTHWSFLHESLSIRTKFTENLIHLQQFLTASLLEDYDGRPYNPSRYALNCATMIIHDLDAKNRGTDGKANDGSGDPTSTSSAKGDQSDTCADDKGLSGNIDDDNSSTSGAQERRINTATSLASSSRGSESVISSPSGSDSEGDMHGEDVDWATPSGRESYAWDVLVPAAELILSDSLVVLKLSMVDPMVHYPGGEVKRLIDEGDWDGLRTTLEEDRHLAQALFNDAPVQEGTYSKTTADAVLRGIEAVEKKYFSNVGSNRSTAGRTLTAGKYAVEPSAGTRGGPQAGAGKRSWKYWETALRKHVSSVYETVVGKSSDVASRGGRSHGSKAYTSSDGVSMSEKTGLLPK